MQKNLQDLEQEYDLELEKIAEKIKKSKAKKILLQFPDAFKPYSTLIQRELESILKKYKCKFFIWFDSCFGACDIPIETQKMGIDLIVQFGHSAWNYSKSEKIKILR
jgi:2-(3-amino-3-carboxypropyl)histidine synthase